VYISNIDSTGPAAKGGCKVGDIIKEIDGKEVNTMLELRTIIYNKNVGDTIILTCADGSGKTRFSQVKLTAKQKSGLITR
jgi:S1-C subfamily serine protease